LRGLCSLRMRGDLRGEDDFLGVFIGERAWEIRKSQESRRPRPGLNLRVAKRGTAFRVGVSRWSAGTRPGGFVGKRKSGRFDG